MNDSFDIKKSPLWNGIPDEESRGLDIRFADCSVYTEADTITTPQGKTVTPAKQQSLCESIGQADQNGDGFVEHSEVLVHYRALAGQSTQGQDDHTPEALALATERFSIFNNFLLRNLYLQSRDEGAFIEQQQAMNQLRLMMRFARALNDGFLAFQDFKAGLSLFFEEPINAVTPEGWIRSGNQERHAQAAKALDAMEALFIAGIKGREPWALKPDWETGIEGLREAYPEYAQVLSAEEWVDSLVDKNGDGIKELCNGDNNATPWVTEFMRAVAYPQDAEAVGPDRGELLLRLALRMRRADPVPENVMEMMLSAVSLTANGYPTKLRTAATSLRNDIDGTGLTNAWGVVMDGVGTVWSAMNDDAYTSANPSDRGELLAKSQGEGFGAYLVVSILGIGGVKKGVKSKWVQSKWVKSKTWFKNRAWVRGAVTRWQRGTAWVGGGLGKAGGKIAAWSVVKTPVTATREFFSRHQRLSTTARWTGTGLVLPVRASWAVGGWVIKKLDIVTKAATAFFASWMVVNVQHEQYYDQGDKAETTEAVAAKQAEEIAAAQLKASSLETLINAHYVTLKDLRKK